MTERPVVLLNAIFEVGLLIILVIVDSGDYEYDDCEHWTCGDTHNHYYHHDHYHGRDHFYYNNHCCFDIKIFILSPIQNSLLKFQERNKTEDSELFPQFDQCEK